MIPSVIANAAFAVCAAAAVYAHTRNAPVRVVYRYFTVLSNTLCAAACLAVLICRLGGGVPRAVLILKYVGTAAVSVTMLTVLIFLAPHVYDFKLLMSGPDLWLHLICPLIAIVSYAVWDRAEMRFGAVLLAVLPVILYGGMYLYRVVLAPPEKRWDDFYGFNRGGRWGVSFAGMTAGAFLIGLALWLL